MISISERLRAGRIVLRPPLIIFEFQIEGLKSQNHGLSHFNMPFEVSNLPEAGPICPDRTSENWLQG